MVKNPPANAGDMGSIPGLGRSPGDLIVLLPWAGGATGLKNRNPPGLDAALEASSNQLSAPSRLLGELRRSLSGEQVSARTSGLLGRGVEVEGWSGVPV